METRGQERYRPGSARGLYGDAWMFIRHVGGTFMPCFGIFFADGCFFAVSGKYEKAFPLTIILYQLMGNNDFMDFRFGGTCANYMQEIVTLRQCGDINGYLTICCTQVANKIPLEVEQA